MANDIKIKLLDSYKTPIEPLIQQDQKNKNIIEQVERQPHKKEHNKNKHQR